MQQIISQNARNHLVPWHEMNQEQRTRRIKQLWSKVRMFVRLRRSLNSVKQDAERREIDEMYQQDKEDADSDSEELNTEEDEEEKREQGIPWY